MDTSSVVTMVLLVICFLGIYATIWFLLLFLQKKEEFHRQFPLKKFPTISVLIPAHNEEKIIAKSLHSILGIDYPKDKLKVIVVDDGSTDRTFEIARSFAKRGVKVYRKPNGGKASAVNYGLEKIRSKLVLTLDTDCFLEKGALAKMVSEMQEEEAMAVIPSIEVFRPKGILQNVQSVEYSFMNFFRKLQASIYSLPYAPAAVLFKSQFFKKYGKLDETTITEDFEIGLRVNLHNYNIAHAFDAKVFTIVPDTLRKLMRQRLRWAYGSFTEMKKHKRLLSLDYGDLGAFVLPQILIGTGILISVLFFSVLSVMYETIHSFLMLQLVGYELRTDLLSSFYIIYTLLDIKIFILIFSLLLSISIYLLVKKTGQSKLSFKHFLIFIFLYSWFLSLAYILALIYFLLGKKPRW